MAVSTARLQSQRSLGLPPRAPKSKGPLGKEGPSRPTHRPTTGTEQDARVSDGPGARPGANSLVTMRRRGFGATALQLLSSPQTVRPGLWSQPSPAALQQGLTANLAPAGLLLTSQPDLRPCGCSEGPNTHADPAAGPGSPSATEDRMERSQLPGNCTSLPAGSPLPSHCPAASGPAWTAPLPQPSRRPSPARLAGLVLTE